MKRSMLSAAILGVLGLGATFPALAIPFPVSLCAGEFQKDLTPDDATDNATSMVTMWGYSRGITPGSTGCEGPFTSPGPRIIVPDAKFPNGTPLFDGVTVTLRNTLTRATSLVIPGTVKGMTPQKFTDADGNGRVRSFDVEAAAGSIATPGVQVYTWTNLQPGSYMYHSGTHPQVQVQMGLYGGLTRNITNSVLGPDGSVIRTGEAYPGVNYTNDITLFYTEIDRVIHEGVAAGNYNETDMQSTVGYAPKHFAIDVDANSGITVDATTGTITVPTGVNPLVRLYNAGLQTHVPTVMAGELEIVAEDGKPYPSPRTQYSAAMPPLKTRDAILQMPASGAFSLTDSAMALSSPAGNLNVAVAASASNEIANGDGNGMVLSFQVQPGGNGGGSTALSGDEPKANRDDMTVVEGQGIGNITANARANDVNTAGTTTTILTYPVHGEITDNGNGDFSYQHDGGEAAQDSLIYALTNAAGESSTAGVIIKVVPVNDAPIARNDRVDAKVGQQIEIRALSNDEDADSSNLSITGVSATSLGTLNAMAQVIAFEATTEGSDAVTYTIADSEGATATAVITLNVTAAEAASALYTTGAGSAASATAAPDGSAPTAKADSYEVAAGAVLDISGSPILGVMANDSFGALVNPNLVDYPAHGAIEMFENGTFIYTHDGSGGASDSFTYEIYNDFGSAKGTVTLNVTPQVSAAGQ